MTIRTLLYSLLALFSFTISAQEQLLRNSNWELQRNGVPVQWEFNTFHDSSRIGVEKMPDGNILSLDGKSVSAKSSVRQLLTRKFESGTTFLFAGEYRTRKLSLGDKGRLYFDIVYFGDNGQKRYHSANFAPADSWTRFETEKRIDIPVVRLEPTLVLSHADGLLQFRNLSLRAIAPDNQVKSDRKYIWREAEELHSGAVSDWGKQQKDYFSGRGGIFFNRKPFQWKFRVPEVVSPDTLLAARQNYFVWLRIYGYLDRPEVNVSLDKKSIARFRTVSNEQSDATGAYRGPGAYYWQKAGSFSTVGGVHHLQALPEGRMQVDAVLITDDPTFMPEQFEARSTPGNTCFADMRTEHSLKSEYRLWGLSDKIATPVSLKIDGIPKSIAADAAPATLHVTLPREIRLDAIVSHWSGADWSSPAFWKGPPISWEKCGESSDSISYRARLYTLSGRCWLFLRAARELPPGKSLAGTFFLESNGQKQSPETLSFKTVALTDTPSFRTILVGLAGGEFRSFFHEYPKLFPTLRFAGLNFINPWNIYVEEDAAKWRAFREKSRQANITVAAEYSPFCHSFLPKNPADRAVDPSGKVLPRPSLSLDLENPELNRALELIRKNAAAGITGVVFDDEMTNQAGDSQDYNPKTKALFRKFLAENGGPAYVDPAEIIRNKAKYAAEYAVWVDFRCSRLLRWYSLYRKAYLEGCREAGNERTLFVPQILRNRTPAESREKSYWDYRKLAEHSDFISPMLYTYGGIKDSADIGDTIAMYHDEIGRKVIAPTLLCEHVDFGEVLEPDKEMFKFQLWESLMQQSKLIMYWYGPSVLNPINLQHISAAIRAAAPCEDIFLNGTPYDGVSSPQKWLRLKALKLGSSIVVYAANYRNAREMTATLKLPDATRRVVDLETGKVLPVSGNTLTLDFKSSRGRLLLLEGEKN